MTTTEIIEKLTSAAIQAELGVSASSVKEAKRAGVFPASWYASMIPMAARAEIDLPLSAFNFREPAAGEDAA